MPIDWSDFPDPVRAVFQGFRSPQGEAMVLDNNMFVEAVLPGAIQRKLSDDEMDHYREPFRNPGEDRRPTLSWPRNIPIEGEPADVVAAVEEYGAWLAESDVPKLFINGEPGALIRGRVRDFVRSWPNQTEVIGARVAFHPGGQPGRNRRRCRVVRPRGAFNFLGPGLEHEVERSLRGATEATEAAAVHHHFR